MRLVSKMFSVAARAIVSLFAIMVAFGFGAAPAFASATSPVPGPSQGSTWGHFPGGSQPPPCEFTWWGWRVNTCQPPAHPFRCVTKTLIFDFPHGTVVLTEVAGPTLEQGESAIYKGDLYTVENPHWTVHGVQFEVTKSGQGHFTVNLGPSIWDGVALLPCAGR